MPGPRLGTGRAGAVCPWSTATRRLAGSLFPGKQVLPALASEAAAGVLSPGRAHRERGAELEELRPTCRLLRSEPTPGLSRSLGGEGAEGLPPRLTAARFRGLCWQETGAQPAAHPGSHQNLSRATRAADLVPAVPRALGVSLWAAARRRKTAAAHTSACAWEARTLPAVGAAHWGQRPWAPARLHFLSGG